MSWWLPQYLTSSGESLVVDGFAPSARMCGAGELFGGGSTLNGSVAQNFSSLFAVDAADNLTLSIIVISIVVSYCYVIYRYGEMVKWSAKNLLSTSGAVFMFASPTLDFVRFIRVTIWLNMLCTAAVISNFMVSDQELLPIVFLGVFVSLGLLRLWGVLLRRVLKTFDYKKERWRDIHNLNNFNVALGVSLFAMPIIVLLPVDSMASVVAGLVLSIYIYNFFRIVYYFIASRFSLLQSFLYLCAVEIVPIALLWGVVSRINIL